jgi:hypothetical protein
VRIGENKREVGGEDDKRLWWDEPPYLLKDAGKRCVEPHHRLPLRVTQSSERRKHRAIAAKGQECPQHRLPQRRVVHVEV